jgi:hypothetical protein
MRIEPDTSSALKPELVETTLTVNTMFDKTESSRKNRIAPLASSIDQKWPFASTDWRSRARIGVFEAL